MACVNCLHWVLCCGSIPSWMQAGLSIRAIKSHLLTPKGTEINSTEILFNDYETLEGELLKSTWTGVKLFLPLSSFHPSFPAKSGSFTWRKKTAVFLCPIGWSSKQMPLVTCQESTAPRGLHFPRDRSQEAWAVCKPSQIIEKWLWRPCVERLPPWLFF